MIQARNKNFSALTKYFREFQGNASYNETK